MARPFRSIRLSTWDYRSRGAYFVTICADQKQTLFSQPAMAAVVSGAWAALPEHFPRVALDEFVVMPNHVHGIVWITADARPETTVIAQHAAPAKTTVIAQHAAPLRQLQSTPRVLSGSLGAVMRSFKSASTKRINELRSTPAAAVWQRNYYERVVRDDDELYRIRQYIQENPVKWYLDRENPHGVIDDRHRGQWGWLEGEPEAGKGVVAHRAASLRPPR